jgi:hypothetical protein
VEKSEADEAATHPPVVETVFIDVIEEPVPGVAVVTGFEAIEMREPSAGSEQLEDSQGD